MRMVKGLLGLLVTLSLSMCQPSLANPPIVEPVVITRDDCTKASQYVTSVYDMAKQGKGNYEIMTYLDSVPVGHKDYPAAVMAKVNVVSIQRAVFQAYAVNDVVKRHKEICLMQLTKP